MAALLTEDSVETSRLPADTIDLVCDLGIWISGLESFCASGGPVSADKTPNADVAKGFEIVHSGLERCALLASRIGSGSSSDAQAALEGSLRDRDLVEVGSVLRDLLFLSRNMRGAQPGPGEWSAWCSLISERLESAPAVSKVVRFAEEEGEKYLPEPFYRLCRDRQLMADENSELANILPRFARILKWLSVVGRMLERDEPLKPGLLVFARVNEQIFELTSYINGRLERFANEEAELFASLDAASYTASIELKKVYSQELAGLAGLRPPPSIYARVETAHALLSHGFQQILAGFARLLDPSLDVYDLFPDFAVKREQSLVLRKSLRESARIVRRAEESPGAPQIESMQANLREFLRGPVRYLFYKDTETVERFVEEILVTKDNKDLVPILHRFGAFLETLFGQVCHRAVLQDEPFVESV